MKQEDALRQPHFEGLDTAFLQLSFALKLWHYLDENPVSLEKFDLDLRLEDEGLPQFRLPHAEFHTQDDLLHAAANQTWIAFGATAITLWEAMREHGQLKSKQLDPARSEREMLASLAFAIRCCFAHGTVAPVWKLDAKYRRTYTVGGRIIDLTAAEGTPLQATHIGGYGILRAIWDRARAIGLL